MTPAHRIHREPGPGPVTSVAVAAPAARCSSDAIAHPGTGAFVQARIEGPRLTPATTGRCHRLGARGGTTRTITASSGSRR
ncbi:hypothetical protein ACN6LA_002016 [Streptomyces sp. SAS_269]|uniref:hypothetical protein n=1 Tax=Streptomyces sp. SAS_269 TaxID=3412749 RepID=UPI00403C6CC2